MDSVGELIDKLSVVNIKIFMLVDVVQTDKNNDIVAEAARKLQLLNLQRNTLINEVNQRLQQNREIIKV